MITSLDYLDDEQLEQVILVDQVEQLCVIITLQIYFNERDNGRTYRDS